MILRGSAFALSAGLPTCACGSRFHVPALASLERVDGDAFLERVAQLGLGDRNALMRSMGFEDAIIRRKCDENRRTPARCGHDGCSRFKAKGSLYCGSHAGDDLPF